MSTLGIRMSEETKRKVSKAKIEKFPGDKKLGADLYLLNADTRFNRRHKDQIAIKNASYWQKHKKRLLKYQISRHVYLRQKWIQILEDLGMNFCSRCGYNSCFAALDFHHIDPNEKDIAISRIFRLTPNKERINEIKKCIALCANCHREIHHMEKELKYYGGQPLGRAHPARHIRHS